jgi:hypothetical protein
MAYLGHVLRLNPEHAAARAALADLVVNRNWPLEVRQLTSSNSSILDVARDGSRILRADGDHLVVDDSGGRALWSRLFQSDSKAFFNTAYNAVLVTSFDLKTLAAYDAQLIYYIAGRTVSRIDMTPINDEEIPMLIELAEGVAGINVSNGGVMGGVFDPSRIRKTAQRCVDGSRICKGIHPPALRRRKNCDRRHVQTPRDTIICVTASQLILSTAAIRK